MADEAPHRPAKKRLMGRQAEAARNDQLVLDAARAEFAEHGFEARVAAVAARAGVGIGSLYRRYGTKEELLQKLCVLSLIQNLAAVEDALDAETAWTGLCDYVRTCVALAVGAFAPLAGQIAATDEMFQLARAVRRHVTELVRRAHAAGALRQDANAVDVLQLIERLSRAFTPDGDEREQATRRRQVEIALSGLEAASILPLPDPAPRPGDYESRWN